MGQGLVANSLPANQIVQLGIYTKIHGEKDKIVLFERVFDFPISILNFFVKML